MSDEIPKAGVPGTGWRMSDSGKRWFQIERGTPEFAEWMRYFKSNGKGQFARFAVKHGRTWVTGQSVAEFGPSMLAHIDISLMKIAEKRERALA